MKIVKKIIVQSGIVLGLSALLGAQPSFALVYKWTDANHKIHYSNTQPNQTNQENPQKTAALKPVAGSKSTTTSPIIAKQAPRKLLFLMIGQSNMQGVNRGPRTAEDVFHPRIFQYSRGKSHAYIDNLPLPLWYWPGKKGDWIFAVDPLQHLLIHHPDTIGLGLTFAKGVLDKAGPNDQVYLLNAALGGTGFLPIGVPAYQLTWDVDVPASPTMRNLGKEAIADLREALTKNPDLTFEGIVWLQGENDYQGLSEQQYTARLKRLIDEIRAESLKLKGDPNIGFIAITMMESWRNFPPNPNYPGVDAAIRHIKNNIWLTDFVNTNGIVNNLSIDKMVDPADLSGVHYSASSLRQIGRLTAQAYQRVKAAKIAAIEEWKRLHPAS